MNWRRWSGVATTSSTSATFLLRGFCIGARQKPASRAALALAGTFDPNVLKKLGFPENVGEVTKARLWYERAQQLGSAEAPQRLEQLATVTNSGK
jgi:hypothetical protein